ncbi:MAG: hypothetical protein ACLTY0_12515, partial [Lachnospiraceae bacterium]
NMERALTRPDLFMWNFKACGGLMGKISVIAYFSHCYLCRRRHKVAGIAEPNWMFASRFLRRKRLRNGE